MSITTRLWSKEDLANIGKDKWLTTIFMNAETFSRDEIKHYPYNLRKQYQAEFEVVDPTCDDDPNIVSFYATDDKNAIRFLKAQYRVEYLLNLFAVSHKISYRELQVN